MKPILFNTEMVRAILDGRKTVTRRVMKPEVINKMVIDRHGEVVGSYDEAHPEWDCYPTVDDAPYHTGDILYVRETCQKVQTGTGPWRWVYRADMEDPRYFDDGFFATWRPSIHMPREAARIFLRVTDVRVERLWDIDEKVATAEGAHSTFGFIVSPEDEYAPKPHTAVEHFSRIWDSTIKPADRALYGWAANPWVWVISFKNIGKPEATP